MANGKIRQFTEDKLQSQMEKYSRLPVIKEMCIKTLSIISYLILGEAVVKLSLSNMVATM